MKGFQKIYLSRDYKTSSEKIFNLFKDGTLFKLTGADVISFDFKTDGLFELHITNRGTISGSFIEIIPGKEIKLNWNTTGFNLEPESETIVTMLLHSGKNVCTLELFHDKIKQAASALAKTKAWKEILDDLEKKI